MSRVNRLATPGTRSAQATDQAGADVGGITETACLDRRQSDRIPFPAELVLAWNHNPAAPARYRVLDAGDGGYRIHSCVPLLQGTTGMVVRLLPGRGSPLGQPVMVAWSSRADDGAGYEIGLRLF